MKSRTRSKTQYTLGGKRRLANSWAALDPVAYAFGSIDDWTDKQIDARGLLPSSPCLIDWEERSWVPWNFKRPVDGLSINEVVGHAPDRMIGGGFHISIPTPTFGELAVDLLAKTNPYRPEYSIPVAISELGDAISLMKLAGSSVLNQIGGNYLNYRFGVGQLYQDVKTLEGLLGVVESRIREFQSLIGASGLRRRDPDLWSDVKQTVGTNEPLSQYSSFISRGTLVRHTKVVFSGTVRWFPKVEYIPPPEPIAAFRQALRVTLDLEPWVVSWDTFWNSLPFTWLIDYFSNLGTILAASKGRQFVVPRYISVSKKTTTTVVATVTSPAQYSSGGSYKTVHRTLERRVFADDYVPSDSSFNCLLSKKQLMVLGALLLSLQRKY